MFYNKKLTKSKPKKNSIIINGSLIKESSNLISLEDGQVKDGEMIYTVTPNIIDNPENFLAPRPNMLNPNPILKKNIKMAKIKKKIDKLNKKIQKLEKKDSDNISNKIKKLKQQLDKLKTQFLEHFIWIKVVKLNIVAKNQNGESRKIDGKNLCFIFRAGKESDLKRWIKYMEKYNRNTVYVPKTKDGHTTKKTDEYFDLQKTNLIYEATVYQKYLQQNLEDYFSTHKISLEKTLKIFLEIIAKLKKMHKNLDIHSDLKPANIMIDEYDEIHIIDFEMTCNMNDEKNKELCQNRIENARKDNYVFFPLPILNGTEKKRSKQFDISSLGVTFWLILGGEKEDYEDILKKYRNKPDIKEQKKEIDKLINDSLSAKKIDKNIIKYIQKMIYIDPKKCPTLEKVEENFELAYQEEKQRKIIRTELNTCFNKIEKKVKTENNKNEIRNFVTSCFKKIETKVNDENNKLSNIKKPKPITPKKQPVKSSKKPRKISVNTKPIGFNPQAAFIAGSRAIKPNPNQIILCYAIAASIVTLSFGFYMITTFLNITRKIPNRKELSNNFNSIVKFLRHA